MIASRMMATRFRRLAVPLLVGAVGVVGLTGCSNKSTDAALMSYTDSTGPHTIHISSSEYRKQLGELVGSGPFQTLLKSHNFSLGGDQKNTTAQDVSTSYLSQLVEQAAIDAQFSTLKLTITSAARTAATQDAKESFALDSELQTNASGQQAFVGKGVVFLSFPKSFQDILVDRQARAEAVGAYYTTLTPTKEQALYNEFATDLCPSGRVVSQIIVKEVATAQTILTELKAGASFADLAKTKSTDTASAKLGGAVGCLRKGTFVAPFEAAAYAAPFGIPTGPVKSQFGYHVLVVNHATYADLQAELTQALSQNPLVARDLRLQSMKVWINPQFGTGSLAVDQQQGQLFFNVAAPVVPAVRTCREKSAVCAPPTSTTTTVPAAG
jgi:hypothetical protein